MRMAVEKERSAQGKVHHVKLEWLLRLLPARDGKKFRFVSLRFPRYRGAVG